MYKKLNYYDDFNNKDIQYTGEIIFNPSPATVLRGQYYLNPSSNYQISGKGVFLDNFLNIEHKNGSETNNVNFIMTVISLSITTFIAAIFQKISDYISLIGSFCIITIILIIIINFLLMKME